MSLSPSLATELASQFQFNSHTLNDADHKLLEAVQIYAARAFQLGYQVPVYSQLALEQMAKIPDDKKLKTADFLILSSSWFEDSPEDMELIERKALRRALSYYGLEVDEEIWNTISKDSVVEIYGFDMTQLFRSYKMLEMTGYSILDLCVFEWFLLWERPQLVLKQMHEAVQHLVQNQLPVYIPPVPGHIMRETFNSGKTQPFIPRSCFTKFERLGVLKRTTEEAPHAYISVASGHLVAEGFTETDQIAFL